MSRDRKNDGEASQSNLINTIVLGHRMDRGIVSDFIYWYH